MKGQYTQTVEQILRYLRILTLLTVLFVIYSVYNDMYENEQFQKMMTCEGYGHDQNLAPNFCK